MKFPHILNRPPATAASPTQPLPTIVANLPRLGATAMLIAAGLLAAPPAAAQSAPGKTPIAQYWIDVATFNMMGMDEMPELPPGMGGMAGMMGGMMGNTSATGRDGRHAKGVGNFGLTKHAGIGRQIDIALFTQRKPNGTEAVHDVPPGAGIGAAPLRLVTPPREGVRTGGDETSYPERPSGRILFYWGCSSQVKAGQPRVLDMAKLTAQDYQGFMQGRSVRDRGARAEPGHAIWPNEQQNSRVVRDASLVGEHRVSGDGVPANMRFTLGPGQDFMPSLQVQSSGKLSESVRVSWQPIASARAYMLTAMSGGENRGAVPELIIWSASEPPESGLGLMDYVANGNVDKWLGERVLLPATQTQCDIPAGIFANTEGAMLQAIAYGNELNIVHPPRPADPRAAWTPEWSVRVRNKSFAMNMLGEEANAASRGRNQRSAERPANRQPASDQGGSALPDVGGLLKGLFGR